MVNYLEKFIQIFLKLPHHPDQFEKDTIEKFETLILSAPIFKIFNPNLSTRLKIDKNFEGLGALLEQIHGSLENPKWHPKGYSSRILRYYEKRNVQMEKETISITFLVKRFNEYLHGCKFTIVKNHQPLKSIFSRSFFFFFFSIQKRSTGCSIKKSPLN